MRGRILPPIALFAVILSACSDAELPNAPDSGTGEDVTRIDVGIHKDAQPVVDAGAPDATSEDVLLDGGDGRDDATTEDAANPDAEVADATLDAGLDASIDAGVQVPDQDGDGISDADEGNGAVDTDRDGTPDTADTDSDGDGVPDAVEAGDADPATAPADTDADGTPDFRDADSDADGIVDLTETSTDTDADGTPDFRDTDSDADGIPDLTETSTDTDTDGTPDFRDTDSDADGIQDLTETSTDTDGDQVPNFRDLDSDGDTLTDQVEGSTDTDRDGSPDFVDTDSDGDLIPDQVEGTQDPDQDGIPNFRDLDSDGDTVSDLHEGAGDADRDNVPNYLDPDSDGDGLTDAVEAGDANPATPALDSDHDGTPNFLDTDSDDDLISDRDEGTADTDNDTLLDRLDIDADNDGILDNLEAGDASLTTPPVDTDRDNLPDFRDPDSDGDTILDVSETSSDFEGDGVANFRDLDSDGDGISDAQEAGDANPATPPIDSDQDGRANYQDVDSDNDGLADGAEPGCPAGSSRLLADSDGDGFVDPAEIVYGSNPCNRASTITDFYFVLPPLDPAQRAPLTFSNTDIDRADLAINIDTTGSMSGEIANLRSSLSTQIIPGVDAVIPDAAFSVSSFEDYPVEPFGQSGAGDIPFRLGTRVTTDAAAAQTAVNALTTRNGADLPEAGLETLYIMATGAGTTWPGGQVAPFNPATGRIAGVADGTIGGVGFRDDSLPIIVQVTDATSHQQPEYVEVNSQIGAATTAATRTAIGALGARIVGIANARLPHDPYTQICTRATSQILSGLRLPTGSDVDWFVLSGATAGQVVHVETTAFRKASGLDTFIGIANANAILASHDDIILNQNSDSRLDVALAGPGPYYIVVTGYNDTNFDGTDAVTTGYYFMDVTVDGVPWSTQVTDCRTDDGSSRANATPLVPFSTSAAAANLSQCITRCEQVIEPLITPYGMASKTGALVPPCAWDLFGGSRPAGCAANQCCTGLAGVGLAPDHNGRCALSFQIDDTGVGLSSAMVAGIEALVRFSAFTITTVVRGDPVELARSSFDTSCFVHGVVPVSATPPNTCAPAPRIADLIPPPGQNDSFENVVPGTVLSFDVIARNQNAANGQPCKAELPDPQLYRAYIDVVADGVTVVDTRDVIIIVPPSPPTPNP